MVSLGGIGSDVGATGKIDRGAGGFSGVPSGGGGSTGGFYPGINPELGGSVSRRVAKEAIQKAGGAGTFSQTSAYNGGRIRVDKQGRVFEQTIDRSYGNYGAAQVIERQIGSVSVPGPAPSGAAGGRSTQAAALERSSLEALRYADEGGTTAAALSQAYGFKSTQSEGVLDVSKAIAGFFGVHFTPEVDPRTGAFGVGTNFNPLEAAANFETFGGVAPALAMLAAGEIPVGMGLGALLESLQGSPLGAVSELIGASIPVGFTPYTAPDLERSITAFGDRVGRGGLNALERSIYDAAKSREAREQRGVRAGQDPRSEHARVENIHGEGTTSDREMQAHIKALAPGRTPAARVTGTPLGSRPEVAGPGGAGGQAIVTRDFRRARGQDTSSDLDLLRTEHEANVLAGVEAARPTVLGGRRTRLL